MTVRTDEDAGLRASQPVRRVASCFESFPSGLEQQTLLRIHQRCLARRNTEERGIKLIKAVEEATPTGIHPVGLIETRGKQRGRVPAVTRHIGNCVAALY